MFSWTSFHVILSKIPRDIHMFQKYITWPYDSFCLAYEAFRMYLQNILKMSKLILSRDPPKDSVTQRIISSRGRTRSSAFHSWAKMKPSCCFGDCLWIFQFCVISAGLYCNQQKPTLANLAKKEVNGRIRQFTEKLKYLPRARPETRRMSGL